MNGKYISIKEFTTRAGISKQRVYQLLEKKIKPYCKTIENNELETILKKSRDT